MSAFGLSMWGHVNEFVYDCNSKVSGLASSGTGIWVLFGGQADPWNNTLIPNREQGAIFSLVGSFGINIRGDPPCIPLSLEGLSKATTCIPCRICSMWMTCAYVMPVYGHAKRIRRIHWTLKQGSMWSPQSSSWLVIGLVHMWLKWRRSSIKSKQLRSL